MLHLLHVSFLFDFDKFVHIYLLMVDIILCCRNPYEERTAHAYHVYSGTGHGSWGYSGMVS